MIDPNPLHPDHLTIHVKGYLEVSESLRDRFSMRPNQFLATLVWPWGTIGMDLGQVGCHVVGDSVVDATANARSAYMELLNDRMPAIRDRAAKMQERLVLYDQALRTFVLP